MRKKICVLDYRIYPVSQDLAKRWFVQGRNEVNKKVKFSIPSHETVAQRVAAGNGIIEVLKIEGCAAFMKKEKQTKAANYVLVCFFEILEEKRAGLRKKSYQSYLSHLRNFNDFVERKKPKVITEDVAREFLRDLKAKGLSNTTINAHRLSMTHFYSEMINRKRIKLNPFKITVKLKENRVGACYMTLKMIEKYKAYVLEHKPFLWLPSIMQFYCFLRPSSELRFIQVSDVDLQRKLIRVESKIAKNGKTEFVKIPDSLISYLTDLKLDNYPDDFYLIGLDGLPAKKPVSCNFWSYSFREVRTALQMPKKYVFYSFKHSGAADYMNNTGDIVGLQRQMRHHSADVTSVYLRSIGIEDLEKLKTGFSKI